MISAEEKCDGRHPAETVSTAPETSAMAAIAIPGSLPENRGRRDGTVHKQRAGHGNGNSPDMPERCQ